MTYTLIIPFPDASLFPNRANGRHWSTRQNAKQAARTYANFKSLGCSIGDTCIDHSVRIIVAPPDKRHRDVDGILAALKPTLDGLADGLQINDWHFNPIEIRRVEPIENGSVTIIVDDDIPF